MWGGHVAFYSGRNIMYKWLTFTKDLKMGRFFLFFGFFFIPCTIIKLNITSWDHGHANEVLLFTIGLLCFIHVLPIRTIFLNCIDPASGGSIDYMYVEQGVTFSYALEGRDKGRYGFFLPEKFIQPSGEENWAAFTEICNFVQDQNRETKTKLDKIENRTFYSWS